MCKQPESEAALWARVGQEESESESQIGSWAGGKGPSELRKQHW